MSTAPPNSDHHPPPCAAEFVRLWASLHADLTYALQPVVNVHNGTVFGYAALLRGHTALGFTDSTALLTYAVHHNILPHVITLLCERAIAAFAALQPTTAHRLLLELDPRILLAKPDLGLYIATLLARHQLPTASIMFELNTVYASTDWPQVVKSLQSLQQQRYLISLAHFGQGHLNLHALLDITPDCIQLDRCLTAAAAAQHQYTVFVQHIVHAAHALGIQIAATAIDSVAELTACRELGCDLVQGPFIAPATLAYADLSSHYAHIQYAGVTRRHSDHDLALIQPAIERLPVLTETNEMRTVFDYFRHYNEYSFFPVVDCAQKPLGLVHEKHLKSYIYSSYGRDLLANPAYNKRLHHFISPCPSSEIHSSVERLLETYTAAGNPPGIIITDNLRYVGFISQGALLHMIDTKQLAIARDQNPLTRLPGNRSIAAYINEHILYELHTAYCVVYLDFDHFKPFNDAYGFRTGDRAITLFADLLHKQLSPHADFIGHIGGDDFFVGFKELAIDAVTSLITALLHTFAHEVQSFYDAAARERGYLDGVNRAGEPTRFPLLGCSAALLLLPLAPARPSPDQLSQYIADVKKRAKHAPTHIALADLSGDQVSGAPV